MTKKALLVGINYPGTQHSLRGCVNDVLAVSEMLTKRYGFKTNEKRMLTDKSATTANILERLEWLVAGAQPGDILFFHYSGHGSQMIDSKYDEDIEPDGLDEIICPVDLDWRKKVIKDDDLKRIFDKVPEGVNLTVVLDCCHSGSALDQQYQYQPLGEAARAIAAESPNRERRLPMPVDIANRGIGLDLVPRSRAVQSKDVNQTGLLISGCQSHQTSADAWLHTKYMGACTYYMLEVLKEHNYDISYKKLVDAVNQKMVQYGYSQRPECNGNVALMKGKFLGKLKG